MIKQINNNLLKLFLLVLLLGNGLSSYGQDITWEKIKAHRFYKLLINPWQDSTCVQTIDEKFSISPVFTYQTYQFTITDQWGIGNPIEYYANVNNRLGAKFRYKGMGFGVTFQLPSNEFIYGKTKSLNLLFNTQFSFLNWGTDFFLLWNKGHYIDNASGMVKGWQEGLPHPTRPDISVTNIGINSYLVLSERFSMKAALHQSEKQIKSAGGISLAGSLRYDHFSADSSVVHPSQFRFYEDIDSLNAAGFLTISLAPGFAYTYVFKEFFITGMIHFGVGVQLQGRKLEGKSGSISPGVGAIAYMNYRIGAGYNGDKFYGSLMVSKLTNKAPVKDSRFTFTQSGLTLNFGMRFN